jgi:hypothetical protein
MLTFAPTNALAVTRLKLFRRRPFTKQASVPIYRLIREAAFEPEDSARMAEAYEAALLRLGLIDRNDPITELLASKIIEIARSGKAPAAAICDQAVKELGARDAGSF